MHSEDGLVAKPLTTFDFYHFRRIQKANTTWRKCGYEEQCVLKNGKCYTFENMGINEELILDTRDFYANVQFNNVNVDHHDFLEISIVCDQEVIFVFIHWMPNKTFFHILLGYC